MGRRQLRVARWRIIGGKLNMTKDFKVCDVVNVRRNPIDFPHDKVWARIVSPVMGDPRFFRVRTNAGNEFVACVDNMDFINRPLS